MKGLRTGNRIVLLLLAASIFLFLITGVAAAATIYVDDSNTTRAEDGTRAYPYNTINEGIAAASDGDTVLVMPGTYEENVTLSDFADPFPIISLQGINKKSTRIIGNIDLEIQIVRSIERFTIIGDITAAGQTIANNNITGTLFAPLGNARICNNDITGGILAHAAFFPGGPLLPLPTVANSILWGNGDELIGVSATYSCIEDGDVGEGNISQNPALNNRYCPTGRSPVIDAGNNDLIPAGITTDFYGSPRIVDGNKDGQAVVDMGACEFGR